MSRECFEGVRRTAWIVATCRGQEGREDQLIASHQSHEDHAHLWSFPGRCHYPAHASGELSAQRLEGRGIGAGASPDDNISGRQDMGQDLATHDLAEPALQAITLNDRVTVLWNNDADSRMTQKGSEQPNLEVLGSGSLPFT